LKHYYLPWKSALHELDDFNSKIEFLQSEMRDKVGIGKLEGIDHYLGAVKKLLIEHEHKLYLIISEAKLKRVHKQKAQKIIENKSSVNQNALVLE